MQHVARRLLRLPHLTVAVVTSCRRSVTTSLAGTTADAPSALLLHHTSHFRNARVMSSSAVNATASDAGDLATGTCEPCRRSTPLMPAEEHDSYLSRLNEGANDAANAWRIAPFVGSGDTGVLQRSYTFRNFAAALRFVNRIGEVAEAQKHHPEIVLGWGHVEVAWWSHAIGGLHKNDFVCAAKTDQVLQAEPTAKS